MANNESKTDLGTIIGLLTGSGIIVIGILTKKNAYSEDENLMHISHEAGVLEDPSARPDASVFSMTNSINDAPEKETIIEIE